MQDETTWENLLTIKQFYFAGAKDVRDSQITTIYSPFMQRIYNRSTLILFLYSCITDFVMVP